MEIDLPTLRIREATRDDYPVIESWARAHGRLKFHPEMMPRIGFIVEDEDGPAVFCALHLSVGVGVAFLEGFFSKPGQSAAQVLAAMKLLVAMAEEVCRAHDYSIIIGHTHPAIARYAQALGFHVAADKIVQIGKLVNKEVNDG